MSKWADYLICAVKFNSDHTHIEKVHTREDKGDKVGEPYEETRRQVVANIEKGFTYCTIFKDQEGGWQKGQQIKVMSITTKYLKTVPDNTTADNLDKLPEF